MHQSDSAPGSGEGAGALGLLAEQRELLSWRAHLLAYVGDGALDRSGAEWLQVLWQYMLEFPKRGYLWGMETQSKISGNRITHTPLVSAGFGGPLGKKDLGGSAIPEWLSPPDLSFGFYCRDCEV